MPAFRRLQRFPNTGMALEAERALVLGDHPIIAARMRVVASEAQAFCERRVDGIVLGRFHEFAMALPAEFRSRGLKELPFVRSVGIMTGITLAIQDGFVDGFFCKSRFRVGVAGVADFVRPVVEQPDEIRPMRIMARGARPFDEGRMRVFGFRSVLRFLVTGETQTGAFFNEQMVVLGGMRSVAGETALLARDRRMGETDLSPFVRMAAEAKFIPALQQEPRAVRGVGVMTLDAHPLLERRVLDGAACLQVLKRVTLLAETADVFLFQRKGFPRGRSIMAHVAAGGYDRIMRARLHELRLVRGMRIVTEHAGLLLNGVVAVRRFERRFAAVVAGQAERLLSLDQKVLLVGAVRKMTRLASVGLHDLVHRFLFKVFFLVALIADFLSFRFEQVLPLGSMGIVA